MSLEPATIEAHARRFGIFYDEPAELYYERHLDEANAGGLKRMLRTPGHFAHWVMHGEDVDTAAKAFGRALHCYALEPDVFEREYCVAPAGAPAYPAQRSWDAKGKREKSVEEAIRYWTAFNRLNAGRTRLSLKDYDRVRWMGDSARAHPVARGLILGGRREVTFRWIDPETGLACKSRKDLFLPGEFALDLKSCQNASHEAFARVVAALMYDLQQAHYVEGIRECGETIKFFAFLAIESEPPFACQPHIIDARAEQRGYALRMKAIRLQAQCLQTGHFPAYYSERVNALSLPAYAYYGIED